MKAPTIKDIAREAGVSHSTVSNVLNGRGNVSVEKIRLVEAAADKLGYRLNAKAQLLRQGKKNAVLLIVPSIRFPGYADLYEGLQRELQGYGYTAQVYTTSSLRVEEEAALDFAMMSRMAAIIAVIGLEPGNERCQMAAREMPLVLLDNHQSACAGVLRAGFDLRRAGTEVAQYLNREGSRRACVFTGDIRATHMRAFLSGLQTEYWGELRHLESTDQLMDVQAFSLFHAGEAPDYIVCTDEHRRRAVRTAHSYGDGGPLPPMVTLSSRRAACPSGDRCYELDYKSLAGRIIGRVLGGGEEELILPAGGFRQTAPAVRKPGRLELLTVNSPSSAALSRLLPHLRGRAGIDLNLTVVSLEELYDMAHAIGPDSRFDLVRMDMAWISELAPKIYLPLQELPVDWEAISRRILPFFLEDYTTARGIRYCLPYDPSSQILFYRKDLFEDATLKRMYYEMYREELAVPSTFAQYNKVARFFTREFNPQSPVTYGTTTAIGNSTVSPSEYMPRLFGEGGSFFDKSGRIALETPQAVAALKNYMETYRYSDKTIYQWWRGALEGFSSGTAAMTIVFMNYASDIINSQNSRVAGRIGFATVPGGKPLIGGGVVGIARGSGNKEQAVSFLQWLYSEEIAPVFTMLGGLSPCRDVYENRDILELYPWLSAAKDSFPIGRRRLHNNNYVNFSEKKLEEILSTQVKNAVLGLISPEEALRRAQAECREQFVPII